MRPERVIQDIRGETIFGIVVVKDNGPVISTEVVGRSAEEALLYAASQPHNVLGVVALVPARYWPVEQIVKNPP